jgi:tetratricopeptide (TPR) repeat protein
VTVKDGLDLEDQGHFDQAARLYRRLLQDEVSVAEQAEIRHRLGVALREDGEPDDAREELEEALRLAKQIDDVRLAGMALLDLGQLSEERGGLKAAAALYRQAEELLRDSTDRFHVSLKLASVQRRRGELAEAKFTLEALQAEALPPELHGDLLDELGQVLLDRGEYEQAVDVLTRGLELDDAAARDFAAGRSQLLLARAHLGRGDRNKAKQLLAEAKTTYEQNDNKRGLSELHLVYGRYYEEANELDKAARSYRQAYKLDEQSADVLGQAEVLRHLAAVRRLQGSFEDAREHLEEARNLLGGVDEDDVGRAALTIEEGLLALREQEFDLALSRFSQALRMAREDGDDRAIAVAMRHLANVRWESGEIAEAEELLRQAMDKLSQRGDRRELAEVLDDLGEVLIDRGKYREAISHLERAFELDERLGAAGSRAWTQLLLGRAYLQLGERNKAGRFLEDALDEYEQCSDDTGTAAALYEIGTWRAQEGKDREAIKALRRSLDIVKRQGDRAATVRAGREVAAAYRRLGDLERAEEELETAGRELRQSQDDIEQALMNMERARLAIARGAYDSAVQPLKAARRELEESGRKVEAAVCLRLMGFLERERRDFEKSYELLEQARAVFEEHEDKPELDELYDDLAEVKLMAGDLDAARVFVDRSQRLGGEMNWYHGRGRSFLVLGDIEMAAHNHEQARIAYTDALRAYEDGGDDVGAAECCERLGDWSRIEGDWDEALKRYKDARRLAQLHRDLHSLARLHRKLGTVYLARGEHGRAEEALEQAEDYLGRGDHDGDGPERAMVHLTMGQLHAATSDHNNAVARLNKALVIFKRVGDDRRTAEARRGLIESYKMLGQADKALEQMRLLGEANVALWQSLVDELHPVIATEARNLFYGGSYSQAVLEAFKAVELRARDLADVSGKKQISQVLASYITPENRGVAPFADADSLNRFREFAVASFDLLRNPASHGKVSMTAPEALSALCVASLIAGWLEPPASLPTPRDAAARVTTT